MPLRADHSGSGSGDDAGSAGHVENTLSLSDAGAVEKGLHPLGEQGGNEQVFVDMCLLKSQAECLGHCAPPHWFFLQGVE